MTIRLLTLLPILTYTILVILCAVDVPYWDDYDSILGMLSNFSDADSLSQKFNTLIALHNEHRLGLLGVISLGYWKITGTINFKVLTILGNLGILLVWLSICWMGQKKLDAKLSAICCCAASFFIFQPEYYDTPLWSTVLLSNIPVIFLTCASIALLNTSKTIAAFFLAVLALFSQGNGILTLPLGFVFILLSGERKKGLIWLACSLIPCAIYFHNFPSHPAAEFKILGIIDHGLTFLGAGPAFGNHKWAIVFGLLEVVAFFWILPKEFKREDRSFLFVLLFLFLTVALNCLGRSEHGAEYVLIQPRYKFLSLVIVAALIFPLARSFKPKIAERFCWSVLASSILFSCAAYLGYADNVFEIRDILLRSAAKWNISKNGLFYPVAEAANATLNRSSKLGIYSIGPAQAKPLLCTPTLNSERDIAPGAIQNSVDALESNSEFLYVDGWAALKGSHSLRSRVTVVLKNKDKLYTCLTHATFRPDVRNALSDYRVLRSGFTALIPVNEIESGEYKVLLRVAAKGMNREVDTGKRWGRLVTSPTL